MSFISVTLPAGFLPHWHIWYVTLSFGGFLPAKCRKYRYLSDKIKTNYSVFHFLILFRVSLSKKLLLRQEAIPLPQQKFFAFFSDLLKYNFISSGLFPYIQFFICLNNRMFHTVTSHMLLQSYRYCNSNLSSIVPNLIKLFKQVIIPNENPLLELSLFNSTNGSRFL